MNYSLKVPAEAKEEIKRAIAFMERHTVDRSVFEIQDSIAKKVTYSQEKEL
jgi:hypothetical protein